MRVYSKHHRSVKAIEKKEEKELDEDNCQVKELMEYRLKTKKGREKYKKRKETVEPVFGIIKSAMGEALPKLGYLWKSLWSVFDSEAMV